MPSKYNHWGALTIAIAIVVGTVAWSGFARAENRHLLDDTSWDGGGLASASVDPAGRIRPAPHSPPSQGTLEESITKAIKRNEISDTRSSDLDSTEETQRMIAAATAAVDPPQAILDACLANDNAGKPGGHVFNRYVWCARNKIAGQTIKYPPGEISGQFVAPYRVIALANPFYRNVHYYLHVDDLEDRGNFSASSPLTIQVGCRDLNVGCSADKDQITHELGDWKNEGWVDWNLTSDETASPQRPEKMLRNNFSMLGHATDNIGIDVDLDTWTKPNFRCDSAPYFLTKACVFTDVIPRLNYVYGDGYDEVIDHIRRAQYHPDQTYPQKTGKVIPGRYPPPSWDDGLFRVKYKGATWKLNKAAKDATCPGLPPPTQGQDCDEYPFASTKQGAGLGDGNFSVQYLNASQNRSAGGKLPGYYTWDRIFYWDSVQKPALDEFWVKAG
ncbi:NucA/NucB deoxyribonuclease domain-containing protein [Amycolatopsis sp. GA6-003]|uniref:NucA/NucB deoxyribonuclease domain-containing protein n=1 Tax=Amycolatopsis sp. GA6-003 TaxID=2652444 RepID=UPI0039171503